MEKKASKSNIIYLKGCSLITANYFRSYAKKNRIHLNDLFDIMVTHYREANGNSKPTNTMGSSQKAT